MLEEATAYAPKGFQSHTKKRGNNSLLVTHSEETPIEYIIPPSIGHSMDPNTNFRQ